MALTSAETARVIDMLDELDREESNRIIATLDAFATWLQLVLIFIYIKIKHVLRNFWSSLRNAFR